MRRNHTTHRLITLFIISTRTIRMLCGLLRSRLLCVCATRIHQNECATSLMWPIDRPPAQPLYLVQTTKTICFCSAILLLLFSLDFIGWCNAWFRISLKLGNEMYMMMFWISDANATHWTDYPTVNELWMRYQKIKCDCQRVASSQLDSHFQEREKNKTHNKCGATFRCVPDDDLELSLRQFWHRKIPEKKTQQKSTKYS